MDIGLEMFRGGKTVVFDKGLYTDFGYLELV